MSLYHFYFHSHVLYGLVRNAPWSPQVRRKSRKNNVEEMSGNVEKSQGKLQNLENVRDKLILKNIHYTFWGKFTGSDINSEKLKCM